MSAQQPCDDHILKKALHWDIKHDGQRQVDEMCIYTMRTLFTEYLDGLHNLCVIYCNICGTIHSSHSLCCLSNFLECHILIPTLFYLIYCKGSTKWYKQYGICAKIYKNLVNLEAQKLTLKNMYQYFTSFFTFCCLY